MAFFGLTALGPQNAFAANAITRRYLQIFDEQDFHDAWRKVNGERTFCAKNKIPTIMEALFHGPVPDNDLKPVIEAFADVDDGSGMVSFATFMRMIAHLQRDAEKSEHAHDGKPRPECEFISSQTFRESRRKNAAMKQNFQNKLSAPLTATMEYGWEKPAELGPPVATKRGSDITKFQAELVKNGIYY
eukprot:gene38489-46783_t